MYQHSKQYLTAGTALAEAKQAIIMIHGRGAGPEDMVSLSRHLKLVATAIVAPQATQHSWYPYSFMAPDASNQPALASALEMIGEVVADLQAAGIAKKDIYFLGFSQGACLVLEYTARNATRYAGVIAFTGGLIGEQLNRQQYSGAFNGTPILLTTGDPDAHVPLSRVEDSKEVLEQLGASVNLKVYPGRVHTVLHEEIRLANDLLSNTNSGKDEI